MKDYKEFDKVYDLGILGQQLINVDYTHEGYKVLEFNVWMFNFGGNDAVDVTDYLTDEARDMIYDDCAAYLLETLTEQAEIGEIR